MLADAETKTRKKQGASGSGGGGSSASGGGGDGNGVPASLGEEARRRYLNYALSVITSRALPDVRDGLKPVQRRILYGMWNDLNLSFDTKYQKCAQVVGAIMGRYHPHGDASIYDALVRMAQDFSLRYPLVDGHGNFGSLDGDFAAAYRYTECRLEKLATELLRELESKTVDFRPSYDGTRNEPIVIPARVPQLLMNGTTGIAVGMATNIPPHHLGELLDALMALIDAPTLATKDLLKFIKGPDFPTGGQILNSKPELREIYETGQGSVRIRGEWKTEELKRGGLQIIVTSIPYTVNKSTLVAKIGDLVRERKLPLIVDVRDESTKEVRIVLELKKDANPELVMAYLYKHTPLQTNFAVNLTCLVPSENPEVGTPKRLDLKTILQYFLDFRFDIVTRRLQHELAELKKRVHILEGFEKAYDALDEIIRIIRQSEGKQDAAQKLMARFKMDELQVDAILEMKLYKLARLEILVVQKELKEKRAEIKRIEGVLKDKKKLWGTVKDELGEIRPYADKRRTRVGGAGAEEMEFSADAFIADEDAHVVLTRDGWIKRVREVKDPSTTRLREGDAVMTVLAGSLKANLVLLSNFGTAYVTRFNDVPASTGYGDPVQKLFKFDDGERVVGALSLDPRLHQPEKLVAVTKQGLGLRFLLAPHTEVSTRAGRRYAKTGEGDEIIGTQPVGERDLLGVLTEKTHALVCKVAEVNELAGPGKGVTVIKVEDGDRVVDFLAVAPNQKDAMLEFETQKGRKLHLTPAKSEVTGRGGKGHEMSRRDAVKDVLRPVTFVPLPEKKE
ncbi:DNA topoisomerase [Corallococcus sp. H22C18031201]|uniref:DNA gyrase/topoisomerase IV subunit A n=1 Tax=Citreicoccus inhibens TaxID=2849499 RepID=UPI000E722C39|nr:DNA topoisomerase IV subunit A [Citreicoccus inhibens]MBU8894962.1 DNA topoisomerase IV subunit A [Citreicoccus inhibens]RJS27560.1 DNA topoisomerase [Corallococcus sp. H22C18031201]